MTRPVVELSGVEVLAAAHYGSMRTVHALAKGRRLEPGRNDLAFGPHIEGVLGELALSIYLNVAYRPEVRRPDTNDGDVERCQVRSTPNPRGSLIVREEDPEDFPYVLALLRPRSGGGIDVELAGWLDGASAKDAQWHRAAGSAAGIHRSAFFVPKSALRPVETLPSAIPALRAAA